VDLLCVIHQNLRLKFKLRIHGHLNLPMDCILHPILQNKYKINLSSTSFSSQLPCPLKRLSPALLRLIPHDVLPNNVLPIPKIPIIIFHYFCLETCCLFNDCLFGWAVWVCWGCCGCYLCRLDWRDDTAEAQIWLIRYAISHRLSLSKLYAKTDSQFYCNHYYSTTIRSIKGDDLISGYV
jgi:hypothetical protein